MAPGQRDAKHLNDDRTEEIALTNLRLQQIAHRRQYLSKALENIRVELI